MHFGRTEKFLGNDLSLPSDSLRTERFLSLPREGESRIYIGCPIWATKVWQGDLYPQRIKPSEFLNHYAKSFNTVELNSSFYHMPNPAQLVRWREETPADFRFCPKVFRGITEDLASVHMPTLVRQFTDAVGQFESRLGLCFAQFSDAFGPRELSWLERFLLEWPAEIPLAVELRHPDWFHQHSLPDAVVNFFYRRKAATVITDTAGRRDALHLSLTQPKVLIRFQGNENLSTDGARLDSWSERIKKWQKHAMEEIYFFTHQPGDAKIPETARLAVKKITGVEISGPEPPREQLELL